ncbi:MAG: hypothetical protein JW388_0727 [Nitrospira sp.]|nr:hypothetical protein [Nitrospira sp.]
MINPFSMKMRRILFRVAPMALRIAISFCFSVTIMVRVLTILKDATIVISTSSRNIIVFSSLSAEKRLRFICIQSRAP